MGSIVKIADLLNANGVFKRLGETWFDEYWMNYGKVTIKTPAGKPKKITSLHKFLVYRGEDPIGQSQ
jgi:hypothetical protein